MADASTPVLQQQRLRLELRRLREAAGLTQKQVAEALYWSASKMIRIESGLSRAGVTDVKVLLDYYGVADSNLVSDLMQAAVDSRTRTWRDKYRKYIDDQFYNFLGFESSARRIRRYQASIVPGLLQTAEYSKKVADVLYEEPERSEVEVRMRLERQRTVHEDPIPPDMAFLLDEAVLVRQVGDSDTMRGQLRHLAELSARSHITIQIIRFRGGAHRGLLGPTFTVFDFVDRDSAVFVEARYPQMLLRDAPQLVQTYSDDFNAISQRALPADRTLEVLNELLDTV